MILRCLVGIELCLVYLLYLENLNNAFSLCANKNASWSLRSAGIFVSGDGKQPRDSRCRSPPDFSLHGEFCKLNLQEVNNGI